MGDALEQAERIVRRAGRLAPQDGGRGHEVRTARTSVRWFDWRCGFAGRRGRRWWVHVRWTLLPWRQAYPEGWALFGVHTYKDEDDERRVDIGCGLAMWEWGAADWPWPRTPTSAKPTEEATDG